jgi:hypothetical protein
MRNDLLIYGKTYKLWRDGEYIGEAVYVDDPNVGESFIKEKQGENGETLMEVYVADEWELKVEI